MTASPLSPPTARYRAVARFPLSPTSLVVTPPASASPRDSGSILLTRPAEELPAQMKTSPHCQTIIVNTGNRRGEPT